MRDEFAVDDTTIKAAAKDDVELLTMKVDGVKMSVDLGGVVRIQDHQGRVTCTAADLRRFLRTMDAAELSHAIEVEAEAMKLYGPVRNR